MHPVIMFFEFAFMISIKIDSSSKFLDDFYKFVFNIVFYIKKCSSASAFCCTVFYFIVWNVYIYKMFFIFYNPGF